MNFEVIPLPEFKQWFDSIKDVKTQTRLAKRLRKAELGNLGDVKPVGEGVNEMRDEQI